MSNPTTPFSWQMPTATDLVTDLPADFEVFGQAVATSMADLLGGTSGQILAKNSNTDMDFVWIANDQGDITGVTATSPLTGGGTSGAITVGIQDASTAQKGSVQLSDSTSTTSSVLAATPTAVKSAYDLANAAIAKSTLTTAGDTIYRNATVPARLGIGTAGQVLTVNSGATAPEWVTPTSIPTSYGYTAGKNKIINGDFFVNQRSFTSNAVFRGVGYDLWANEFSGGSCTQTAQTFTPGTAPVAGYEFANYLRIVTAGQSAAGDYGMLTQRIEDVRTFAAQTVTMSFWAKAATGTPKISFEFQQNFGSGGSPSAQVNTYAGQATLSTSWVRYTITATCPSISGKTIGTTANTSFLGINFWLSAGSTFNSRSGSIGIQNATFDIAGVQLEAGSTATAFQTATGTIQGELAACQRYYYRSTPNLAYGTHPAQGQAQTTTAVAFNVNLPQSMRVAPTAVEFSGLAAFDSGAVLALSSVTLTTSQCSPKTAWIGGTVSGATAFRSYFLLNNNDANGYLGLTAEL